MVNKNQFTPQVTAIKRRSLSAPISWLVRRHYILPGKSTILDYGCGYGQDVLWLRAWNQGKSVIGYDPYHRDTEISMSFPFAGQLFFDNVLCTYVFNEIDEQSQLELLRTLWRHTRAGGYIYIAVRRDVAKGTTEYKHSDGTWHLQRYVELDRNYFALIRENTKFAIYRINENKLTLYLHDKGVF